MDHSEEEKDAKRPALPQEREPPHQPTQWTQVHPYAQHLPQGQEYLAARRPLPPTASNVPPAAYAGDRYASHPGAQQQAYAAPEAYSQPQSSLEPQQQPLMIPYGYGQPQPYPPLYYTAQQQVTASYPREPYIQPRIGRLPADRPLIKLSVSLIDTYKHINQVYYEERDARRRAKGEKKGQGTNNHGWDDENYDYIITAGELFYGRYKIKERIGKGSFGQVVRAEDVESKREVAIKIIKSKKPFLLQAKTEIELLTLLCDKDLEDEHNIVRLLTHFMYRNHQCLVFEMLSLNLYELLKNTQFGGVSLNLIRKFAKQVLKALQFLARRDVDVIHCDLKPENILLRHPKKSGIKVIDFGSSCRSNKRMYSYIQSRFYRSPEVMLGLPYSVAIDMWSLGCILAEMHTGEPLFSGSDQFDQMQKIVKLLGMVPDSMLERSSDQIKSQFFVRSRLPSGEEEWTIRQVKQPKSGESPAEPPEQLIVPSRDPIASLTEVITAGSRQKKKFPQSEAYNSQRNYELFIDLVYKMLAYEPSQRITPEEALEHPFIASSDLPTATSMMR